MTTEEKKPQRAIPCFHLPEIEPRTICGLECEMRRLRATEAPRVITRLLSDFGSVTAEIICSDVPGELISRAKGLVGASKERLEKMGAEAIKFAVASQAFQNIAEKFGNGDVVNLHWYTKKLLLRKLTLSGVQIRSMEELDRTGAPPYVLGQLLLFALEVNFNPTLGGLGMSIGSSDHHEEAPAQAKEASRPPLTTTTVSADVVASIMTGQSVRRRAGSNGTSGAQSSRV